MKLKKMFKTSCLLFIIVLVRINCASADESLNVSLKLQKGLIAHYHEVEHTSDYSLIDDNIQASSRKVERDYEIECTNVNEATGTMTIRQKLLDEKFEVLDSNSESGMSKNEEYDLFQNHFIGQDIYLKISPRGKILDISGHENIAKKMLQEFPNLNEEFVTNEVKQIMSFCFGAIAGYPANGISVDQSWETTEIVRAGFAKIEKKYSFILKDVLGDHYLIDSFLNSQSLKDNEKSELSANSTELELDMKKMARESNMKVLVTSEIKLDRKTGLVLRHSSYSLAHGYPQTEMKNSIKTFTSSQTNSECVNIKLVDN